MSKSIAELEANPLTIVRNGYIAAMDGEELCVCTEDDEMVRFVVKNHDLRWALYCKHVKITIERVKRVKLS